MPPETAPASLHDILTRWKTGEIGYREALRRADIDTLDELYDAAHLSGVPIRKPNADRAIAILRANRLDPNRPRDTVDAFLADRRRMWGEA